MLIRNSGIDLKRVYIANQVHLWHYKNYSEYSKTFVELHKDNAHQEFNNKIARLVNKRETQVCLSFTFWGLPEPKPDSHIYEMRSYSLKPGTLIEWGNNWYYLKYYYPSRQ